MKSFKHLPLAAAVGSALLLTACATAETKPADEHFVVTPQPEVIEISRCDYSKDVAYDLKPGMIYICPKFAAVFSVRKIETPVNEQGRLTPRIFGKTKPYSNWQWLWNGEKPYRVAYRFIWFDKDGKLVRLDRPTPIQIHECLPGDEVRFSSLAPTEECKSFCFSVGLLHDSDLPQVKDDLKKLGAELDQEKPPKEEPLKQVRVAQ